MPGRPFHLENGNYYHVYNRGSLKQDIFESKSDYKHFLFTIQYYLYDHPPVKLSKFFKISVSDRVKLLQEMQSKRKSRKVQLISYCLMPNHYHFLLKQNLDFGISNYMSLIQNSYTKYFNTKHDRDGHLVQGRFKAVHITSDEQLLHVSRYIHLNPLVAGLCDKKSITKYEWSSYSNMYSQADSFLEPEIIIDHFKTPASYINFHLDHADYATQLEFIKHLSIDS